MKDILLEPKASIQIQKPVHEVFEAIVNPQHMSQYFIAESTGRLKSAKDVVWKFPEFEEEFSITNVQVQAHERISFIWDPETVVEIMLEEQSNGDTVVKVKESAKQITPANVEWAMENSAGWGNFLACLKAYLEYGIRLRKGAFTFMQNR
jgi:uncharacterized protein YndB with AHSA1/START domain